MYVSHPSDSAITDVQFVVFELVSAFGGIGLTLGIPTQNYSFSGAFGPLSKLVVIVIMVRGRHRGLPVAIDRASKSLFLGAYTLRRIPYILLTIRLPVLLPQDLVPAKRDADPSINAQSPINVTDSAKSPTPVVPSSAPMPRAPQDDHLDWLEKGNRSTTPPPPTNGHV